MYYCTIKIFQQKPSRLVYGSNRFAIYTLPRVYFKLDDVFMVVFSKFQNTEKVIENPVEETS